MSTPVEQIKERLSILDVVSPYVQLQKAGKNFKGKSPFTNEKTPSFFVSPDRGVYYCFSSGKGGDIFRFIEEMEGVDFKGALKILADRAHVELVPENPQKRTERETLYELIEAATVFFSDELAKRPNIRAYLAQRGVSERSIARWRIGYAPEGWRTLKEHLTARGFSEEMILRSGLIKQADEGKNSYDVFRDRVLFPIADTSGRIVAFSGRTMSADSALPKYVNSPETELYEKSHVLFGYDKAKQRIRSSDFSLIVEGQFDLVLAHQCGFTNTVAISGTALSAQHVALLSRLSRRVVLALDADRAGVESVKRASERLLESGMDVKVARMPAGSDPADLVAKDPALLKEAVRNAVTVIEFLLAVVKEQARDERAFRLSARDSVLPFVARIPDRIDREYFEQLVSTRLGTTKDAVHHEVDRLVRQRTSAATTAAPSVKQEESPAAETSTPETAQRSGLRADELVRFIYGILLWQEHLRDTEAGATFDFEEMRNAFRELIGEDAWRDVTLLSASERARLSFEAELHCASLKPSALEKLVHEYFKEISERSARTALAEARRRLHEAERAGDEAEIAARLKECSVLQKKLSVLSGAGGS